MNINFNIDQLFSSTGHSVGELGCAYADGCLTAEEMILSAYSRGLVSLQTPFIRGSMAAIGVGYEKVRVFFNLTFVHKTIVPKTS